MACNTYSQLRRLALALALVLIWAPLSAGPLVQSWVSSKGVKVIFVEAPALPMVDVRFVFDAGSARDAELAGVAALTNTLLSDGAGELDADQFAEALADIGVSLSVESLRDMAVVSMRSLTEPAVLDQAMQFLASALTAPRFAEDALERRRQQTLVALQLGEQSAATIASKQFYASLYGDHPYARDPAGTADSVSAITGEDVRTFFAEHYVTNNAVVAVVGALDRTQVGELIERVTAEMAVGEKAPALPAVTIQPVAPQRVNFASSQTHIYLGQPGLSRDDPDYFPLYVGNHVFGGSGLVSMLSEEVREARGLAYSAYSYFMPMRAPGPFMLVTQTRNDRASEALTVMQQTLADFIASGPTAERLEAARKNLVGGFPLEVASNRNIVTYIAMMAFYDYPLDYLDTFVDKVEAVTVEQIRDAFQRRIQPDNFTLVTVGGEAG
jgi:zinc protease